MTDSLEYKAAVKAQHEAANPAASRLASANAGSGKTRVLVDRVSRILIQGVPPEKILCLTYTKAAASEMQSRLFKTLGEWSILKDDKLDSELVKLMGNNDHGVSLKTARQLFAKALETPEGLKVQTIHAFCERILARFPIEAGILPGFEPLDDADMVLLRESVRKQIYKEAANDDTGGLNQALRVLTSAKAEQTLDTLFKWMALNEEKIRRWDAAGGTKPLVEYLGLELPVTPVNELKRQGWQRAPTSQITQAASEMLGSSSSGDVTRAERMLEAFTIDDPVLAWDQYSAVFQKSKKDGPIKTIVTQQAGEFAQLFFSNDPKDGYDSERERVLRLVEKIKSTESLVFTEAFLTIAREFTRRFKHAKHVRRGLDFSDQIILVRDLLKRKDVSDWIRYKLDGGIEHVLLDEAQDTSPEQWEIINSLAEPFTQDNPDRNSKYPRTLFAVGDEKQSIYSFQGAEPERFLGEIRKYSEEHGAQAIRMKMSFRSAPEILQFVDQIFVENKVIQHMFDVNDYAPASDLIRHTANRKDHGRVDIWPAVDRPESEIDKDPWDTTPVDSLSKFDAREQLANAIAIQIRDWIKNQEPIFDRDLDTTRPVQAGDVLILVRQRSDFFDAVIRNLKTEGVAVAGADRLKLKDAIVVKDLLSLARFTLLPSDSLSLAEVLKSPLFGFNDEALFEVAAQRGQITLWRALQDKKPKLAAQFKEIIKSSSRYAPYEFFTRVLDMADPQGIILKRRVFERLGLEAKDAVEAFLARALAHQRQSSPSLEHFVQSFVQDEQELKRDMDGGTGEVRVMTVHGSKGLEAPIVFLPDTTQVPTAGETIIKVDGHGFALPPCAAQTPEALKLCKEAMKAKRLQEYLRLLYVAMTRAESRLIICGYKTGQKIGKVTGGSWYKHAQAAFEGLITNVVQTPFGDGLSFGRGAAPVTEPKTKAQGENSTALPPWISSAAPLEGRAKRRVTPSHLLAPPPSNDMPVRSPLSQDNETRFARGNLIHKLLEILPDVAPEKRRAAAQNILAGHNLSAANQDQIADEVFAVLDNPEFSDIFAPGSRAEISLAGSSKTLPPNIYLNAQIDRISVTDERVYIIDYKSNRPPPKTQDGVADIYWGQMAAYRELAREIYPSHAIVSALLWTDGPSLMVLDDKRLDVALTQIAALPT